MCVCVGCVVGVVVPGQVKKLPVPGVNKFGVRLEPPKKSIKKRNKNVDGKDPSATKKTLWNKGGVSLSNDHQAADQSSIKKRRQHDDM